MNLIFILLGALGPTEIILIIAVVLLLFGGRKIPELMKGLGSGIREFKKASQGDYDKDKESDGKAPIEKN
jgi:sec-independent protein translocase protein TatA